MSQELIDHYNYINQQTTYKWFQTVMFDFTTLKWSFLAQIPNVACIRCENFIPISSVTFIDKSGNKYSFIYLPHIWIYLIEIWTYFFLDRFLLVSVNLKLGDLAGDFIRYYSMDFTKFSNQWTTHDTNIPKTTGT